MVTRVTRREASTGVLSSAFLATIPGLAAENAAATDLPPPRADGGNLSFRLFGCAVRSVNTRANHCQSKFCRICYGRHTG